MPSSCKFGFLPIQVALVLDDLPGQLRVSFKYYTFLFPFSRILYSTYVDKVWIFPFFTQVCKMLLRILSRMHWLSPLQL